MFHKMTATVYRQTATCQNVAGHSVKDIHILGIEETARYVYVVNFNGHIAVQM